MMANRRTILFQGFILHPKRFGKEEAFYRILFRHELKPYRLLEKTVMCEGRLSLSYQLKKHGCLQLYNFNTENGYCPLAYIRKSWSVKKDWTSSLRLPDNLHKVHRANYL